MDGFEVARKLRANPNTMDIPILMLTAKSQLDDKVNGFEAGADDYLTKPTHPAELQAHVTLLLERSNRTKEAGGASKLPVEKRGFTVGVLAYRGGLGVTTTAVNLGSALVLSTKNSVIVAELRPGFGTLAADLGQEEDVALTDLLKAKPKSITRQTIKDKLYRHDSGLSLLLASSQPRDAALIDATAQFETLVERLGYLAPFLILDLGSGLPQLTQKLIKMCHHLVVLVEPVPNSITHAKALLKDLHDLGYYKQNITPVVVNRVRSETQMNWTYVQERLEIPIPVMVMPSPEVIFQANRKFTTAVASQPDSSMGEQFKKLAEIMVERSKLEK
jgi:MinD-like ATPase involved in chromosome partitioning or flagellar assembly